MNGRKSVTVIGGGIAGMAASVFLADKGFDLTLVEASPKLGGRAYSFFDRERNQFFDNGQHLFAGWYRSTFEFLKIINSYSLLDFQKKLEVNFIDIQRNKFVLRFPELPFPHNLTAGLLKFNALRIKDKLSLYKIKDLFDDNDIGNYDNTYDYLLKKCQTERLLKYFWEPFCLAVFNTALSKISPDIFKKVLNEGFKNKINSLLVFPATDLNKIFADPALEYLKRKNARIIIGKRVKRIIATDRVNFTELENDERIESDYYVSAVPFYSFRNLFEEGIYEECGLMPHKLKSSSIVSLHLFLSESVDKAVSEGIREMTGLIGTTIQWIFKKGERYISLVISGADETGITEMQNEEIFKIALRDLEKTLKGFRKDSIVGYKVIKEKRATFIPDKESDNYRCSQRTKFDNFFICGDWTDTGLPATIESAVRSAKTCCELILNKD